jgi:hypothetical protein
MLYPVSSGRRKLYLVIKICTGVFSRRVCVEVYHFENIILIKKTETEKLILIMNYKCISVRPYILM